MIEYNDIATNRSQTFSLFRLQSFLLNQTYYQSSFFVIIEFKIYKILIFIDLSKYYHIIYSFHIDFEKSLHFYSLLIICYLQNYFLYKVILSFEVNQLIATQLFDKGLEKFQQLYLLFWYFLIYIVVFNNLYQNLINQIEDSFYIYYYKVNKILLVRITNYLTIIVNVYLTDVNMVSSSNILFKIYEDAKV